MPENNNQLPPDTFNYRVQELARYLLLLRKMQDRTSAELMGTLGNLSVQELNVLNVIGDNEPSTMSEIAKHAALSLSSVTVIVDKLVKGKFVERIRSEDDRRVVRGRLTAEGKKIYYIQIEHMHNVLRKVLNMLTTEEQDSFLRIFQKLTQTYQI